MQKNKRLFFIIASLCLLCSFSTAAQNLRSNRTVHLLLGETTVKVNVYERAGAKITFVGLHHDEQLALETTKEAVKQKGGRLIELVSLNENRKPARMLNFVFENSSYRIDPNRIFTRRGRSSQCSGLPENAVPPLQNFADELLKILLPPNGNRLRIGERVLVAVHNNRNVDALHSPEQRNDDLTAFSFVKGEKAQHPLGGAYRSQAAGVFLANGEEDEDNFFYVSSPKHLNFLAGKNFNVVLQKSRLELIGTNDCALDDGSLSVFAGQQNIDYINIEADLETGRARQKQMLETVYELLLKK